MKKYSTPIIIIQSIIIFGLLMFALLKKSEAEITLMMAIKESIRADSAMMIVITERDLAVRAAAEASLAAEGAK